MRVSVFLFNHFNVLLLLSWLPNSVAAGGHPLDTLQPGHWLEVPSSAMREVCPPDNLHGLGYDWSFHCQNVTRAWSGGAYDANRDRLMILGGGHADYAGNEVYVFDVAALAWQRLDDPSDLTGFCDGGSCPQEQIMPDGRPPSRHTYDGLQYLPGLDRFWSHGGSLWRSGNITDHTWHFNPSNLQWARMADAPDTKASVASAYDPTTGQVYLHGNTTLLRHDPVLDQWTTLTNTQGSYPLGTNAALDPVRRWLVMIGRGNAFYYDLNETLPLTRRVLVTSGANEIVNGDSPGFEYDPVSDRLVAWSGESAIGLNSSDVYLLDLDSLVWTRRSSAPSNTVTPSPAIATGTFGRFRYIPSRNVFILVNDVDDNVFFYRLTVDPGTLIFADGFESN